MSAAATRPAQIHARLLAARVLRTAMPAVVITTTTTRITTTTTRWGMRLGVSD